MNPDPNVLHQWPRIAILIPCLNEEKTVGKVVADFLATFDAPDIFVYDNDSTDATAERAREAGAIVRHEIRRGKGNVVRRMLGDVEADIYVMVDGDSTYDANSAAQLVKLMRTEGLDLVNGARVESRGDPYRLGHRLGNRILTGLVRYVFHSEFRDMLSGLKVLSRRFAKSFPAVSEGFEIETEMVIHSLEMRMPVAEIEVPYRERAEGTSSKLSTVRDGLMILRMIGSLIKEEKPLPFFGAVCALLAMISIALGLPIVQEYLATGLVPRFPTAILASGLMILAFLSLAIGFILDTVTRGRKEMKRIAYLSIPSPAPPNSNLPASGSRARR